MISIIKGLSIKRQKFYDETKEKVSQSALENLKIQKNKILTLGIDRRMTIFGKKLKKVEEYINHDLEKKSQSSHSSLDFRFKDHDLLKEQQIRKISHYT